MALAIEPRTRGVNGEEPLYVRGQYNRRLRDEEKRREYEEEIARNNAGTSVIEVGPNLARPIPQAIVEPPREFEIEPRPRSAEGSTGATVTTDQSAMTDPRTKTLDLLSSVFAPQTDPNAPPPPEIGPRPDAPLAAPLPAQDVSFLPPERRLQAILTAAGEPAMPTATRPTPPDHIQELSERLHRLQTEPVVDRNGRFKSFFSNLWHALGPMMQQAQANAAARGQAVTWGDFFAGLAGSVGSGIGGIVNPASDEFIARMKEIERVQGPLDRLIERERKQAMIDAQRQRRATAREAPNKQVQDAAQAKLQFMRANNGGKLRDTPETRDLLRQAGFSDPEINSTLSSGGGGPKLNLMAQFTGRDGKRYQPFIGDDGRPHVMEVTGENGEPLRTISDEELMQLELNRIRTNEDVARFVMLYGRDTAERAKLRITKSVEDIISRNGGDNLAPDSPQTNEVRASQVNTPPDRRSIPNATRPRTAAPVAIPAGLDAQEPVGRSPYGRGGYVGRGSSRGGGQDAKGQSITANKMLDEIPRFEAAKRRGNRDEAIGILNEVLSNPNTRNSYEGGLDANGNPWLKRKGARVQSEPRGTAGGRVGPRSHASVDRQAEPIITRGQLRQYAAYHGMSEAEAEQAAAAQGYMIEEDDER